MTRRALASTSIFVLLIVASVHAQAADSGDRKPSIAEKAPREQDISSCGLLSLYVLSRLEGCHLGLETVSARLPEVSRDGGLSLAEIRDAAAACGLSLQGVQIQKGDWPLDRPAIVHLDRHTSGHFVVIRPVGHSGKLVQVIDGDQRSEVLDFDLLSSSPDWTGMALIPRHPNWIVGSVYAVLIAGTGLVFLRIVARLRGKTPQVVAAI